MEPTKESSRNLRLGDILVDHGLVSDTQLAESLKHQIETGARLGEVVTQLGYVSSAQLSDALAWQTMYGLSALAELLPNPEVAHLLTENFCRVRFVLPVDIDSNRTLILAMVDPGDVETIDDVRLITGLQVRPVTAVRPLMAEAWDIVFSGRAQLDAAETPRQAEPEPARKDAAEYEGVISLVDKILTTAIRRRATDIHFEPVVDRMLVRVRVDGVMSPLTEIRDNVMHGVVSRIKIMANMDIAEKRVPQDGRASLTIDGRGVDLRVASIPSVFGEGVTVRILDEQSANLSLAALGMDDDLLATFRNSIRRPWGEVLITGPTGSGKSTTLYAGLNEVSDPGIKIYTVEDPVERRIQGVVQSQVHPGIGVTFARMLRALLRSDPNVIMIGEIRDQETAMIATEASLTGHLVLSTLHTNDAATAVARLQEMGVPAYLITSTLELVVAQRLARRLCSRCKRTVSVQEVDLPEETRAMLGVDATTIAQAVGCKACYNTGYSGRVGLFEVLPITADIRRMVMQRATADDIRGQARSTGVRSLREDGVRKVLAGITTVEEVIRVTA